jgi:hypothetical protein
MEEAEFLAPRKASARLRDKFGFRMGVRRLEKLRAGDNDDGPPFRRVAGQAIVYPIKELDKWARFADWPAAASCKRSSGEDAAAL